AQNFRGLIFEKSPFFALSIGASVITLIVQTRTGSVQTLDAIPIGFRITNSFVSYIRYLDKTFWPSNLCVFYPHPSHWPLWQIAGAVLLLALITILFIRMWQKWPYLLMGWFWFLGMLVPMIGLVQTGTQAMADRHMYLPAIGIFIIISWGLNDVFSKIRWLSSLIAITTLVACIIATSRQITYWQNSKTLFEHAIATGNGGALAYNNVGQYLLHNKNQPAESINYFKIALKIDPRYETPYYNLGNAFTGLEQYPEAIDQYKAALKIRPDFAEAHNNLGSALEADGKSDEAFGEFQTAIRLKPDFAEAHYNLADALTAKNLDEALKEYERAIQIRPDMVEAHNNFGSALSTAGRLNEAIREFKIAIRLKPDMAPAHNNLGNVLLKSRRFDEAVVEFETTLKLNPDLLQTRCNLAICLANQGKSTEAESLLRNVLRDHPDFTPAQELLKLLNPDK
ncbi:MAG TPA: tetratricopeptide repeat protein, partial [Candidatus Baltobacteraceae bacterium]|nr:tetratricopeptide repeat protein [Candidatus Baltobacteraceae bacterium]